MSTFQNVCSLPLSSDLFSQSLHPSLPFLAVGLSAGHVQAFKLPLVGESSQNSADSSPEPQNEGPTKPILRRSSTASAAPENGLGEVEMAWRTKRHKGSCRCVAFSPDGDLLFSAGTDGLVKAAIAESGQVISKIAVPLDDGDVDTPALVQSITPQTLLLATDSSALYLYDIRVATGASSSTTNISSKPSQIYHPHTEYVSSITALPTEVSNTPKQFVTTGGTTLAVIDLRKGLIVQSEDQEEELEASVFIDGLKTGGTSRGQKVVVGESSGVLTLWEKGIWDDQDERIVVDAQGSEIEQLVKIPESVALQGQQKVVAAGLGDGRIRFVKLGVNKVVKNWDLRHDELEGVIGLGFDIGGRMVSGGGQVVNVWRLNAPEEGVNGVTKRRGDDNDESEDEASEEDDSEQEEQTQQTKRKKRKRVKGKERSGGNHVIAFKGME